MCDITTCQKLVSLTQIQAKYIDNKNKPALINVSMIPPVFILQIEICVERGNSNGTPSGFNMSRIIWLRYPVIAP